LKQLIYIPAIRTDCFVVPPRNDGSFNGLLNGLELHPHCDPPAGVEAICSLEPDKQQKKQPDCDPVISKVLESVVFYQFDNYKYMKIKIKK
jgi:hypothetical protein